MGNASSSTSTWEYGKELTHYDSADFPIWAPAFMTRCRKGRTAQELKDLLVKRAMTFVVEHIPKMRGDAAEARCGCYLHLLREMGLARPPPPSDK